MTGVQTCALPISPLNGYYISLDNYSTSTIPAVMSYCKGIHAYLDPTVTVTAGTSSTQFSVSPTNALKFSTGNSIYIHDVSYTNRSSNVTVLSVNTGTGLITVSNSLGFTPAAGMIVELIGFPDSGAGYMFS